MYGYKQYCANVGIDPRLYLAWINLRQRCTNMKWRDYHRYGGRGITFCDRWKSFAAFAEDMGLHPGKGWSLERKRVNEGYTKDNCEWQTATGQARNRRSNKLTLDQVKKIRQQLGTHLAIAKEYGVSRRLIGRIKNNEEWA